MHMAKFFQVHETIDNRRHVYFILTCFSENLVTKVQRTCADMRVTLFKYMSQSRRYPKKKCRVCEKEYELLALCLKVCFLNNRQGIGCGRRFI